LNDLTGSAQYRDETRGIDRIRRAADLGYAPAQTAMAFYSETANKAFEWCKKAADQGDALGQWCVGTRYLSGNGTIRNVTSAEQWLRKAADQGNPFAAYMVGVIKLDKEPKAAAPWFEQAAEQGLPQAQRKLARLLP
jgi:TPR repeat protein